jgi:hypothetical protein
LLAALLFLAFLLLFAFLLLLAFLQLWRRCCWLPVVAFVPSVAGVFAVANI